MTEIAYTWRKNRAGNYGYYNTQSGVMVGKVELTGKKWSASLKGFRPKSFKQLNEAKSFVETSTDKRLGNGQA